MGGKLLFSDCHYKAGDLYRHTVRIFTKRLGPITDSPWLWARSSHEYIQQTRSSFSLHAEYSVPRIRRNYSDNHGCLSELWCLCRSHTVSYIREAPKAEPPQNAPCNAFFVYPMMPLCAHIGDSSPLLGCYYSTIITIISTITMITVLLLLLLLFVVLKLLLLLLLLRNSKERSPHSGGGNSPSVTATHFGAAPRPNPNFFGPTPYALNPKAILDSSEQIRA